MLFGGPIQGGRPPLEHWGPMGDGTSVHAAIYHGDDEESPMCDISRGRTRLEAPQRPLGINV